MAISPITSYISFILTSHRYPCKTTLNNAKSLKNKFITYEVTIFFYMVYNLLFFIWINIC